MMRKRLGENRKCIVCGKIKYWKLSYILRGKGKYCSIQCHGKDVRGIIPSNLKIAQKNSPIQKGNVLAFKNREEKHWAWQKENPSYRAVHAWIRKKYGLAQECQQCGSIKNVQWANISRKYKRERSDFVELCASCHKKFDLEYKKKNRLG